MKAIVLACVFLSMAALVAADEPTACCIRVGVRTPPIDTNYYYDNKKRLDGYDTYLSRYHSEPSERATVCVDSKMDHFQAFYDNYRIHSPITSNPVVPPVRRVAIDCTYSVTDNGEPITVQVENEYQCAILQGCNNKPIAYDICNDYCRSYSPERGAGGGDGTYDAAYFGKCYEECVECNCDSFNCLDSCRCSDSKICIETNRKNRNERGDSRVATTYGNPQFFYDLVLGYEVPPVEQEFDEPIMGNIATTLEANHIKTDINKAGFRNVQSVGNSEFYIRNWDGELSMTAFPGTSCGQLASICSDPKQRRRRGR